MLVIGSGASGPRGCRVGRAGRRPRRGRDEGVAPVLQLGQGAGRDPGIVRRGRLARAPRRGRLEVEPRDGRHAPRRGADRRRAVGDPLARGARRPVHAGERRLPDRQVRRRVAQAPAPGRATAPATRSPPGCARPGRRAPGRPLPRARSPISSATENGWRRASATTRWTLRRSCSPPAAAVTGRPRSAASSPPTIPAPPVRSRRSRSASVRRRATSTRSSTTRTAEPGPPTCRATRSPRPPARTAPCC